MKKLTICIPIYNTDAHALVNSLQLQIERNSLQEEVEITVIDDASTVVFQQINATLSEKCNFIQLKENVGRSKIRNLFLTLTQTPYLLFLDGDSLIDDEHSTNFILNYLTEIQAGKLVVCGGRIYPETTDVSLQLSYLNGIHKESKPANVRMLAPNASFMTNNFMIQRAVFSRIQFDERLTQYGHEDTLFGLQLQQANIAIHHIENPVINGHIEENVVFLKKSELALENLKFIVDASDVETQNLLVQHVRLLSIAAKIRRFQLTFVVKFVHRLVAQRIQQQLVQGKVDLKRFDFYKLGYYLRLK